MSSIVWLASYPKSGNTWLRALLANFLSNNCVPDDINQLKIGGISSDRRHADDALGVECSDLTSEEIDRCRAEIYRYIASRREETLFIKTHDAWALNADGEPLFPADVTRGAVYLVRNPLDLCISLAHHTDNTVDETIYRMGRESMTLAPQDGCLHSQLHQRLLSWSQHVMSWMRQNAVPLHVVRYEAMCLDPVKAFREVIRFLGLDDDLERVQRAVKFSSFDELRRQELSHGFKEKPAGASSFFRSGRIGEGREVLTCEQVNRLVRDHEAVMGRLGYLVESGKQK